MTDNLPKRGPEYSWQRLCGPISSLLKDPSISEIMINGPFKVFVEQNGIIKRTSIRFNSENELLTLMQKLSENCGKKLDKQNPIVDASLPDGSRINCLLPPIAVDGPSLTIRRFPETHMTYKDMVAKGTMDQKIAYFLSCCVQARLNILISGSTGAGKTTLLNILSSFIPIHERIVTIEDAPELRLANENLVRMETRPASTDEAGISVRQLLINSLRMRPDRIIVGECRGPEAWDMLAAMNTGHEGSMTTVHANSAREALRRVETMTLMAGMDMPLKVIRQHIGNSLNLVIQIARDPAGVRRITQILEIGRMEGEVILTQDIFNYQHGKGFVCPGFVPQFVHSFSSKGIRFPADFFTDAYQVKG